jgi:hypothetical protein
MDKTLERVHAPVFPLPTVNLFPETTASYHIFEPRYREMIQSVLEGDRLLALAVLKPGYEDEYYGSPEIYPIGCLAKVQSWESLENGTYNIVVEGLYRVGFGETVKDNPYRVMELHPLPESDGEDSFTEPRENILLRLNYLAENSSETMDFSPILTGDDSFISMINMVCRVLPMSNEERYALLALDSVEERANRVLWHIDDQIETLELFKRVDPRISDIISFN